MTPVTPRKAISHQLRAKIWFMSFASEPLKGDPGDLSLNIVVLMMYSWS